MLAVALPVTVKGTLSGVVVAPVRVMVTAPEASPSPVTGVDAAMVTVGDSSSVMVRLATAGSARL